MAALGGSLEASAMAKSGIIKLPYELNNMHILDDELILRGPFLLHIERILIDKASLMHSQVVSAYDDGIRATINGLSMFNDRPCQSCDIMAGRDFKLSIELFDVKLCMIGNHQLHKALTVTCAALCLHNQVGYLMLSYVLFGLKEEQFWRMEIFLMNSYGKK